jgi:hypothetical protein
MGDGDSCLTLEMEGRKRERTDGKQVSKPRNSRHHLSICS